MRNNLLIIFLLMITQAVSAQKLTVESMQATNDLSASQHRRQDLNGNPCGLVKVRLATAGATFEGNIIQPIEYKTGEYWVYMTKGSKELHVKHPSFLPIEVHFGDYGFGKGIQSLTTYTLTLVMPQIAGMDVDDGNRFLAMTVEPKDAMVYIDNQLQRIQDGVLSILLPMGQHQYRVEAPACESKSGIFILGNNTYKLDVKLESAIALLNINSTIQGTQIYVNDQLKGTTSWSGNLPPGIYRVEGRLQNYRTHRQSVTLTQHDNKQITIPALQAKTGTLSINYKPLDAEVWIDGQKAGTSPNVFRNIAIGKHEVEIRMDGFTTKTDEITVEDGKTTSLSGLLVKHEEEMKPTPTNSDNSDYVKFTLYGTQLQVRFNSSGLVKVNINDKKSMANCMYLLGTKIFKDGTFEDCQKIRKEMHLGDWAYIKLLDKVSKACLGDTNESIILMTALFLHSDYTAMSFLDNKSDRLGFGYHSNEAVYNTAYVDSGGKQFYIYGDSLSTKSVSAVVLNEKGKSVDLKNIGTPIFTENLTNPRTIRSKKNTDFVFTFNVNKNLLDFYHDFPSIRYDNFMTRWEIIANQPLDQHLQNTLIKDMKDKVKGLSQQEAVQQILWWVQSSNEVGVKSDNYSNYESDEIVRGHGTFYSEETLFYPFNDSKGRAILLSRLIRDVVGLKVLLVYYSADHLATAVDFTDVQGLEDKNFIPFNGRKYIICDPTYIGSTIGEYLPGTEKEKEKVILLQ